MTETDQRRTHFDSTTSADADAHLAVDIDELRSEVQDKYRAVAEDPGRDFHFHTGRFMAARAGYDRSVVDTLPDLAVESFAGVANPFHHRDIEPGEQVIDIGSGAGFDTFLAGRAVGPTGRVIGVDMTPTMLAKARSVAAEIGAHNVEFREGFMEELPVDDGWADVVISNGVFNLAPDKKQAFTEVWRTLRSGGVLQFADIANGRDVPDEAMRHIDLWTG